MAANLVKSGERVLGFDVVRRHGKPPRKTACKLSRTAGRCRERRRRHHHAPGRPARDVGLEGCAAGCKDRGAVHRLFDHRCGERAEGTRSRLRMASPRSTPQSRAASAARRRRRSPSWSAARRGIRARQAGARPHGKARRALRRGGQRPGRKNLQQHDPRHLDDCRQRSLRSRRKARFVASGAVRCRLGIVGTMLVADQLLPGARAGAGEPANNGYKPGFAAALMLKDLKLAREAAESVESKHRARRACRRDLRALRSGRPQRIRLLRDHQSRSRAIGARLTKLTSGATGWAPVL